MVCYKVIWGWEGKGERKHLCRIRGRSLLTMMQVAVANTSLEKKLKKWEACLLYTSDAADDYLEV